LTTNNLHFKIGDIQPKRLVREILNRGKGSACVKHWLEDQRELVKSFAD
jgi:hypothetical protein